MADNHQPPVLAVTGASAGLGRATVRAFADAFPGARIGLLARGHQGLAATRAEVEAAGGEALELSTDVADPVAVEAAAAAIEDQLGPLDIWVNNAMTSVFAPVKELTPEEIKRVTEVTYLGAVHGTLAALRRMLPRNRGVIIQVGSALAYRSIPLQAAYCGAKHAILGFTQSLRTELLHDHSQVRVSIVQMPAMNTPQFDWVKSKLPHKAQPVPPIYQPEVAARAVVYAARHRRSEIFVGGSTVEAIEGNKVASSLLDNYLGRTGFASQQTDEPENPDRPNNLWNPVEGDRGAHGRFDAQALDASAEVWWTTHRPHGAQWAAGAAVVVGAGAALGWLATRHRAA